MRLSLREEKAIFGIYRFKITGILYLPYKAIRNTDMTVGRWMIHTFTNVYRCDSA